MFYWAPEWIMPLRWHGPARSRQWQDRTLFDRAGHMRPAMDAFATPLTDRS